MWGTFLSALLTITGARPNERVLPAVIGAVLTGKAKQSDIDLFNSRNHADRLGEITAPTLLMQGTVDTLVPLGHADLNARALIKAGWMACSAASGSTRALSSRGCRSRVSLRSAAGAGAGTGAGGAAPTAPAHSRPASSHAPRPARRGERLPAGSREGLIGRERTPPRRRSTTRRTMNRSRRD